MGWFSGLLCVGSVIGAVTWGSLLHTHNIFYEAHAPGIRSQQFYALNTSACQWFAVFYFCYGLQFMCFTCTKLLLLRAVNALDVALSYTACAHTLPACELHAALRTRSAGTV